MKVAFKLLTSDGTEARIPHVMIDDYPIPRLRGQTEVSYPAIVSMGPDHATRAEISWEDEDEHVHTVSQSISI